MLKHVDNPDVLAVINAYPADMSEKLRFLRQLILDTAESPIEEVLKWGEPAYLCKTGSTIRIDRVKANPDQYAMYFHCKTMLIETFKELYRDQFSFSGNRAIMFFLHDEIPVDELKHCILLSLTYHKIKHLLLLGV